MKKLRFKKDDIVTLNQDIILKQIIVPLNQDVAVNTMLFKKGTTCKIVYVDRLFRCYDIEINDITITEVADKYFK